VGCVGCRACGCTGLAAAQQCRTHHGCAAVKIFLRWYGQTVENRLPVHMVHGAAECSSCRNACITYDCTVHAVGCCVLCRVWLPQQCHCVHDGLTSLGSFIWHPVLEYILSTAHTAAPTRLLYNTCVKSRRLLFGRLSGGGDTGQAIELDAWVILKRMPCCHGLQRRSCARDMIAACQAAVQADLPTFCANSQFDSGEVNHPSFT
jgi:hypothetical protein